MFIKSPGTGVPGGAMPTIPKTAFDPRHAGTASRTWGIPVVSKAKSTPSGTSARTSVARSLLVGSMVWVAPSSMASSRLTAMGSARTMRLHPAITAPITALKPTDPPPRIRMLELGVAARERVTPPTPVWMPQPSGPINSSGTSSGNLTTFRS